MRRRCHAGDAINRRLYRPTPKRSSKARRSVALLQHQIRRARYRLDTSRKPAQMHPCGFFLAALGCMVESGLEKQFCDSPAEPCLFRDFGNPENDLHCLCRSLVPMAYVLHQLLTESAARRPDAEAVRLLDQALSYAELEKLSNQLAHALIEIGVVPGDRIGIYLHKSPFAIASLFGIMKTGACYVPVDPNAPGLRLAEIARQCGFRALITSSSLYEKLSGAVS